MDATPAVPAPDQCARCARDLSGELPVRLPDARLYCAACCDRMATEQFELETGEPFTKWIEKHPRLEMRHAPMEIALRRVLFFAPLVAAVLSVLLAGYGMYRIGNPPEVAPPVPALPDTPRQPRPQPASGWSFLGLGLISVAAFSYFSLRQLRSYLRAEGFSLTLEDGRFTLHHGAHEEAFGIEDVTQSCVVRPGTVGALEGALGLKDGRMLTLDTCLTDLHALGVVMDLRFREDFPPSQEEQWQERRDKLRKIRGLE